MFSGNDPTHPGTPLVSHVIFSGQDPGQMRLEVRRDSKPVAIIVCSQTGVMYYDYVRHKYLKAEALATDADWGKLHDKLDALTGTQEIGNLFASTLNHQPMLDLAENYSNVGSVAYRVRKSSGISGDVDVLQSADISMLPLVEHGISMAIMSSWITVSAASSVASSK